MRPRLTIVSGWNFTRAYGTLLHLGAALTERGIDVEAIGRIPSASLGELTSFPFPARSWYAQWYGRLPKLRYVFASREIRAWLGARGGAVLNTDLHFFDVVMRVKRTEPDRPWIQMCYELQLPEEYAGERNVRLSVERPAEPDLWVDVEPNRARARSERLGIPLPLILPNTLPSSTIPTSCEPGSLSQLAGGALPSDRPVLLYVGSASIGRSMSRVVGALKAAKSRPFLLAFIHGNEAERSRVELGLRAEFGPDAVRVCPPVPRQRLLSAMREADAGLVYYPHADEPTLNHLFCAPQKAFEYLGAGLPVVTTGNPSMRELLHPQDLGASAADDTAVALAEAIDRVLMSPPTGGEHRRIESYFREELSFERVGPPIVDRIEALVKGT